MGASQAISSPPISPTRILFDKKAGWYGLTKDGEVLPAGVPDSLARSALQHEAQALSCQRHQHQGLEGGEPAVPHPGRPSSRTPRRNNYPRPQATLPRRPTRSSSLTDFDREGEVDRLRRPLNMVREVAPELPARRARYSALIKGEVTEAFVNLVELRSAPWPTPASPASTSTSSGVRFSPAITLAKFGGFGNVRSAGRVQTPTLALVVERERERMAFVPEDYWQILRHGRGVRPGLQDRATPRRASRIRSPPRPCSRTLTRAATGTVTDVAKRSRKQQPPVPFNTTRAPGSRGGRGHQPRAHHAHRRVPRT